MDSEKAGSYRCVTKSCVISQNLGTFPFQGPCPVCAERLVSMDSEEAQRANDEACAEWLEEEYPTEAAPEPEPQPIPETAPAPARGKTKLTPQQKRALASIRKLIAADDSATVEQGLTLLRDLDDRAVAGELADGLEVKQTSLHIESKSEVQRRVKMPHRAPVAMAIARLSGMLDGVEALAASVIGWVGYGVGDLPAGEHRLELRWLAGLPNLKSLHVSGGGSVGPDVRLADLGELPYLTTLSLRHCHADLTGIDRFPSLRRLALDGCTVESFSAVALCSSLQAIELHYVTAEDLDFLRPLRDLRALSAIAVTGIRSLEALRELEKLTSVCLADLPEVTSVDPLVRASNLENLTLRDLPSLVSVAALRGVGHLRSVSFSNLNADGIEMIDEWRELVAIEVRNCPKVWTLGRLANAPNLGEVEFEGLPGLRSLESLRGCRALERLHVRNCSALESCNGAEECVNLVYVSIDACNALVDVRGLAGSKRLDHLILSACESFSDAKMLEPLGMLSRLDLRDTAIKTLKPLGSLTKLKSLTLPSRRFRGQEEELREALPRCSFQ